MELRRRQKFSADFEAAKGLYQIKKANQSEGKIEEALSQLGRPPRDKKVERQQQKAEQQVEDGDGKMVFRDLLAHREDPANKAEQKVLLHINGDHANRANQQKEDIVERIAQKPARDEEGENPHLQKKMDVEHPIRRCDDAAYFPKSEVQEIVVLERFDRLTDDRTEKRDHHR